MEKQVERGIQLKEDGWLTKDGLTLWHDRVYIPKIPELQEKLIKEHHDSSLTGHPGIFKMIELITRNYWWPQIKHDVEQYMRGCESCQ